MSRVAREFERDLAEISISKKRNSYHYRISDVLFDVLDFLPLFPAQKSLETNAVIRSSISIYLSSDDPLKCRAEKRNKRNRCL